VLREWNVAETAKGAERGHKSPIDHLRFQGTYSHLWFVYFSNGFVLYYTSTYELALGFFIIQNLNKQIPFCLRLPSLCEEDCC